MGKKKKDGKIFTPDWMVQHMLYDHLFMKVSPRKHIIDNSCGDGAFLCEIVDRYCKIYISDIGNIDGLRECLETFIHGIELDPVEYQKCLENLDRVALNYGVNNVKWDIQNRDALSCRDYDGKMDYVIANPPYIRTHDLECDLTGYSFADAGMTDIYLAFYELGFRMLNETGRMVYIAPSSWFTSLAGKKMREYIMETRWLYSIENFCHAQVFENATTYVAIASFKKDNKHNYVRYRESGGWVGVSYDDMCIDGKFYFGTPDQLNNLREIFECGKALKRSERPFQVKNSFATLADNIFIMSDVPWVAGKHLIPVVKSSTGKWANCIFPYDTHGKTISEAELKETSPMEYEWLSKHKGKLLERATTEPWYAFGRTQAINDVYREKWAIKSIIKTTGDLKPVMVPAGSGIYGGLYVLCDNPDGLKILETEDFMSYVKMLGKYKSGGYYAFSSKELEDYLNWSCVTKKSRH